MCAEAGKGSWVAASSGAGCRPICTGSATDPFPRRAPPRLRRCRLVRRRQGAFHQQGIAPRAAGPSRDAVSRMRMRVSNKRGFLHKSCFASVQKTA